MTQELSTKLARNIEGFTVYGKHKLADKEFKYKKEKRNREREKRKTESHVSTLPPSLLHSVSIFLPIVSTFHFSLLFLATLRPEVKNNSDFFFVPLVS